MASQNGWSEELNLSLWLHVGFKRKSLNFKRQALLELQGTKLLAVPTEKERSSVDHCNKMDWSDQVPDIEEKMDKFVIVEYQIYKKKSTAKYFIC